jgi:hypothetical protein
MVFDSVPTDVKYSLADLTAVTPSYLTITAGYTGKIGLPRVNEDEAGYPYWEYRGKYLEIGAAADAVTIVTTIGEGEGSGSSRINLNFGDAQYAATVLKSGPRIDSAAPPILLQGTHVDSTLTVMRGDVGVGYYAGESSHLATLYVGYISNQSSDAKVYCGADVDIINATIKQVGGQLTIDSTTSSGDIDCLGGILTVLSAAHSAIEATGGTVYYQSTGTITTLIIGNKGVVDFSRIPAARTVTNCTIYKGATIRDPFESVTWTNGIILSGCTLADVTLDIGSGMTLKKS